jgi:hypothetical protein
MVCESRRCARSRGRPNAQSWGGSERGAPAVGRHGRRRLNVRAETDTGSSARLDGMFPGRLSRWPQGTKMADGRVGRQAVPELAVLGSVLVAPRRSGWRCDRRRSVRER